MKKKPEAHPLSTFVKYSRNKLELTQEELALKAGVGLRFIRDLEQGKESLRLDKVNQVLRLFGYDTVAGNIRIFDPYDIMINYLNIPVTITLKNQEIKKGFIVKPVRMFVEIDAWQFVPMEDVPAYQKRPNDGLTETIVNATINNVQKITHEKIRKSLV